MKHQQNPTNPTRSKTTSATKPASGRNGAHNSASGNFDKYTDIAIIFNPNSTGNSELNAQQLAATLKSTPAGKLVRIVATDGPGRAEQIAYDIAMDTDKPLIISSSGDGGYNEVVNGVLKAQQQRNRDRRPHTPVCGLLPSGNANDHYRNLHRQPIEDQILSGQHRVIDMLSIEGARDGKRWQRYAHSYIGVGLTPQIGRELNKVKLNRFREAWIVVRTLRRLRGSRLMVRGRQRSYDSLIFSNIGSMSKILTISDSSELSDGKFEIIAFPTRSRWYLFSQLIRASTVGLQTTRQASHYTFSTVSRTHVQLDGEIFRLDAGSEVRITLETKLLRCII